MAGHVKAEFGVFLRNMIASLNCPICPESNYPVNDHKASDEHWDDYAGNEDCTVQFRSVDRFGLPVQWCDKNYEKNT